MHRELVRLAEGGLLVRSQQGNQVLYQANRSHPVFAELAGLFRKTSGVVGVLQEALLPLSTQIKLAWVFGSVARGEENADSDVDVLVIGETSFTDLVRALHPYQALLGREINPVLHAPEEFTRKLNEGDLLPASCWRNRGFSYREQKMTLENLLATSRLQALTPDKHAIAKWLAAATRNLLDALCKRRNLNDYDGDPIPDGALASCLKGPSCY